MRLVQDIRIIITKMFSFLSLEPDGQVFITIENLPEFVNNKSKLFDHIIRSWVFSKFDGFNNNFLKLFTFDKNSNT